MKEMARWHVLIHRHQAPRLPALKARLGDDIRKARDKLGPALQAKLLDRLGQMPDGDRLCHGDFHPSNVMGKLGDASIIDWLEATRGEPVVDVCQSWLLMERSDRELAES